jgi:hypothetical protein
MWVILASYQIDNGYWAPSARVTWERKPGGMFRVVYGTSEKEFSGRNADIASCRGFGEAVRHAAECNGLLDD